MKGINILKSAALSIASLTVGFIAISFPFRLFDTLTGDAMHIIFISEILIYSLIGALFLVVKEKKKQEEIKNEKRHELRRKKIEQVKRDWIDIAA